MLEKAIWIGFSVTLSKKILLVLGDDGEAEPSTFLVLYLRQVGGAYLGTMSATKINLSTRNNNETRTLQSILQFQPRKLVSHNAKLQHLSIKGNNISRSRWVLIMILLWINRSLVNTGLETRGGQRDNPTGATILVWQQIRIHFCYFKYIQTRYHSFPHLMVAEHYIYIALIEFLHVEANNRYKI